MRLQQIDAYLVKIPFRMPFKHSLANHFFTENLVIKVTTDTGFVGYGEGIARTYVTGETAQASLGVLRAELVPRVQAFRAADPADLFKALKRLMTADTRAKAPAACCALELAILDAAGKMWGRSLAQMLGGTDQHIVYSAVIPMTNLTEAETFFRKVRAMDMSFLKLKVGGDRDLELLAAAREILGNGVDIRVDANGAWTPREALIRIAEMRRYGISAVEQPVAKQNIRGLKQVGQEASIPVIADESLCTEQDAKQLASIGGCQIFNLRLSKCGGILAVARLYEIGRKNGIAAQLGCHVGETEILASAGRHFAGSHELVYLEGSYSRQLLKEAIVNEPVTFGSGGLAQLLDGPGLGVTVNEEVLERLVVTKRLFRL